jgi:hypothetical protein
MKERGASVLMDPPTACERETLYPAFKIADLASVSRSHPDSSWAGVVVAWMESTLTLP